VPAKAIVVVTSIERVAAIAEALLQNEKLLPSHENS